MNPKRKHVTAAVAVAGAGLGLALMSPWSATAGHSNTVLETSLDGRSEVGPDKRIAGDPNGRGEAYVFGVDGDPTTLCYVLTVSKIGTATAAHIHEGPAGGTGGVVATLAAPADGNAADCLTEGEAGKTLTAGDVQEILANPEDYYVNVHNAEYPNGAIRGQLRAER